MIVRLYSGSDGESHFEDLSPAFEAHGVARREVAPAQDAQPVFFGRFQPGYFSDWHLAPCRQYVIMLAGEMEIVVGDGTSRRFGPGDVVFAQDVTGHGHTTRVVSSEPRVSMTVPLRD